MLVRFASIALVLLATACSSNTDTRESPAPTPAADGGASEGGGACGSLDVVATPVTVETLAEAPPAAQGGALTDGTFVSTRGVLYVGTGGDVTAEEDPLAVTIRIAATRGEILREGVVRVVTLTTAGTTLTTTGTCPATKVEEVQYTATSDTLVLHVKRSAGTLVETFKRQ